MAANWLTMIGKGLLETLYMTTASTALAYLFGLPLGVVLVITRRGLICPRPWLNSILDTAVNLVRSIPFLILLVAVIPVTRFITGTTIGSTATIVPLVLGAIPFVGRVVESSLNEVDKGVIEAALSMGATPFQIITKVLLSEAYPSLLLGAALVSTTILGYSALAGVVGGGGLGDLAIRYGYYRYETDVMLATIAVLVVVVQLIQAAGNLAAQKADKRKQMFL